LAAAGESTASDSTDGPGGVARLRDRLGELPAASPWLPRQLWKRIVIGGVYGVMLAVVGFLLVQPLAWAAAVAPVAEHLLAGSRPVLAVYATTALWFAAGQFAALIGWYRSHSENDFGGRYRVWALLAAGFAGASFLAGTGVHVPIAQAALPYWRWPMWQPETMSWFAPLALVGTLLWWRMDRDVRRCLAGLWLTRIAGVTMIAAGCGHLFAAELAREAWYPVAMALAPVIGLGTLVLGLWLQACFVAYVCADPPEAARTTWFARIGGLLRRLWPFGRRAANEEETKPTRRRKKTDDEDSEAAPKRRRKPAAKAKRTTKPRTRVKPGVEEADDESAAEDAWESEEDSWDESADAQTGDDAEWQDEEESKPVPPATSAKAAPVATSANSRAAASASEDDDESEDDDHRIDGPHENAEMFKGLSKRQRRDLKKQLRDQQRNR